VNLRLIWSVDASVGFLSQMLDSRRCHGTPDLCQVLFEKRFTRIMVRLVSSNANVLNHVYLYNSYNAPSY
jgi:hypothetical protein